MTHQIEILGEDRFCWESGVLHDVIITHSKWSTIGMGNTLQEAIDDLVERALIIKDAYVSTPNSELSEEAIKLKIWLAGIKKTELAKA